MKFLLAVIFLCGVASSLALPRCSIQDIEKCMKDVQKPLRTVEDLDDQCKGMECATEYFERCNETAVATNYRFIYGILCPDNREIREKIVENAQCFGESTASIIDECDFQPGSTDAEGGCGFIREKLPCMIRVIERKCNKFIADIFEKIIPKSFLCKE